MNPGNTKRYQTAGSISDEIRSLYTAACFNHFLGKFEMLLILESESVALRPVLILLTINLSIYPSFVKASKYKINIFFYYKMHNIILSTFNFSKTKMEKSILLCY